MLLKDRAIDKRQAEWTSKRQAKITFCFTKSFIYQEKQQEDRQGQAGFNFLYNITFCKKISVYKKEVI